MLKATSRLLSVLFLLPIFLIVIVTQVSAETTASLLPSSDGNYTQWTPNSGSTHYTTVDETTCNGNTDYNNETTVGQRDSYGVSLSSIPNNATITQISITPCVSKNASGGSNTTLNVFYRLNGVDSSDAGGYSLSSTTPSVQSATNFSGLSTVKTGSTTLEIGAVYSAGNKGARLSQISTVITYTVAAPTVTTGSVSNITQISASVSATINPNGGTTHRYYKYDTVNTSCNSFGNETGWVDIGSGTSNVSPNTYALSPLGASTTYYYCAVATNSGGTTYGSVLSFTTLPVPTATTNGVSLITNNSASVSATINPNGGSTDRYYRYDTTNTNCNLLANSTSTVNIGSGFSNVTPNAQNLTGLTANTTYYYCVVASNPGGTVYGLVNSFTTLPNAPTVTTLDATEYTGTNSAKLNSTVNPNGGSTTVTYKYGTTNVACSSLPTTTTGINIGSGTADVTPNSKIINNLTTATTYYFCAVATNSGGTTYGDVLSFTTDP